METTDKPQHISFDDFLKVELRKGTILTVEAVPKSKKLLKLTVSFGPIGTRTIMAGIAQNSPYGKVENDTWVDSCLVGQSVTAVLNLAPRTMMGVESHGMLLAAHAEDGKVWLVNPTQAVPDGASIG